MTDKSAKHFLKLAKDSEKENIIKYQREFAESDSITEQVKLLQLINSSAKQLIKYDNELENCGN